MDISKLAQGDEPVWVRPFEQEPEFEIRLVPNQGILAIDTRTAASEKIRKRAVRNLCRRFFTGFRGLTKDGAEFADTEDNRVALYRGPVEAFIFSKAVEYTDELQEGKDDGQGASAGSPSHLSEVG